MRSGGGGHDRLRRHRLALASNDKYPVAGFGLSLYVEDTSADISQPQTGRYIAKMCRALGMEVIVAARKNADAESLPNGHHNNSNGAAADPPRLPFDEVLRCSTVLMLALPLSPSSTNLISTAEFKLMHPSAVLVNISRGGIVDEPALLAALREGRVYGYGTDVFAREPAGSDADSVLLSAEARGLNLALTPHLAWLGDLTMVNIQTAARENIKNFVAGTDVNVIA